MDETKWRGSFAIPMTPFDDRDRIDEDTLADEIEFCVEAGAGGIVAPVMVSEFFQLAEDERRTLIRVAVQAARGRVPVVANVAAVNTPLAVRYAEYAVQVGADAVIAMPPYIGRPDAGRVYEYYAAIDAAVDVPVWIQNCELAPVGLDEVLRLCGELEHVSWVKEEVSPEPERIAALLAKKSPALHGVMGGAGGRWLITERQRGAAGCVHACQFCDLIQRTWELLDAGRLAEAGDLFEKVLPALVIEGLFGMACAKEIMIRRGIFKNNRVRSGSRPLSPADLAEIDRVWERIQPYLTWHKA